MQDWENVPEPADAAAAERCLERWREQLAALDDSSLRAEAQALHDDAVGRRLIAAVGGNSPYLALCLTRDLPFACRLWREGPDATFSALLEQLVREYGRETDMARLMSALRIAKRRAALLIALADIAGRWPLGRVTAALSALAETALELAVAHLLRRAHGSGALELPDPDHPTTGSGLIILAMGKFGARELNYSSDIDLIVFYDDARVKTRQPDTLSRTFTRFAKDLVRIMDERTRDGYVFRTDLRLRPDPGATPPAIAVSAAEIYYASVGQNWERAALIKARPVASDPVAAAAFKQFLVPFIWRRNLDFAAIQDIHSIKRQINAHKGHRQVAINGHDIKVGRGGIREIEFFAQTQQLIFGGRDPRLRTQPTCQTLGALVEAGRVKAAAAVDLIAAYKFLRRVEHRIQMVDDQQTHQLPKDDAGVAALAVFLGFPDAASFRDTLLMHFGKVEDHYADLFEEAPPLAGPGNLVFTGTDDDPGTVQTLRGLGFSDPSAVITIVASWHRGRYRCMRSARARELLTEITPALLQALAGTRQPDEALHRFDGFMSHLPAGLQLFSLFYANPWLLEIVADIMGTAPKLAGLLSKRSALVDGLVTPGWFGPLPDAVQVAADYRQTVAHAHDFEDALLLARRWVHDQSFRAGVHILRNITDGDHCGPFLSALADTVLTDCLARVGEDFARRHGRLPGSEVAIVAMGKLGSSQMTIGSDLDLIIVYDTPPEVTQSDGAKPLSPNEYYIKLTQRLIAAITAPSGEGRLYEVDMRLRPSGNAGPVAVSLKAFAEYQRHQAWTWEHMALTRARVLGPATPLRQRLEAEILAVLTTPRDPVKLLLDVAEMRRRVDREFATKNPWEVKYARGGFMDITFIAQYLMLRHAPDHPEVLSPNTATALSRLAAARLLEPEIAADLEAAHRQWRRIQGLLRLTTGGSFEPNDAPPALMAAVTRCVFPEHAADAVNIPFAEVDARVRDRAALAYQHFQMLIDEPAEREHLERLRNQVPM